MLNEYQRYKRSENLKNFALNVVFWGAVLGGITKCTMVVDASEKAEYAARQENVATILNLAEQGSNSSSLTPGQVIGNSNCKAEVCDQGTIIAVPTKDSCGLIFLGQPGEPLTTGVYTRDNRGRITGTATNPKIRSFCLKAP